MKWSLDLPSLVKVDWWWSETNEYSTVPDYTGDNICEMTHTSDLNLFCPHMIMKHALFTLQPSRKMCEFSLLDKSLMVGQKQFVAMGGFSV